jgi:hypothetical protein
MALNFPDSPTNGQKYTDATSGETWTYESSTNSWTSDGLTTAVGVQYKGGINVTTAPPAGVKGGWQYTVTTGGAVNAGFTGLTGNIPSGTTIIFDGTNWQQAGAGVQWVRTGTELSPSSAGDSVFTSGAVKVGGTTAAPNLQIKADGGIVANTDGLVYDAATKRLGIGTTAPDPGGQGLHVHNSSAADSSVRVTNSTTGATNGDGFAIQCKSDGTAALRQFENSSLTFETNATERGRWDSSGRFLVGLSSATGATNGKAVFGTGNNNSIDGIVIINTENKNTSSLILSNWTGVAATQGPRITFDNSGVSSWVCGAASGVDAFDIAKTWGTPLVRVDGSGRLLVGTSTARANYGNTGITSAFQVEGVTNDNGRYISHTYNANDGGSPVFFFAKSRGTSLGSNTVVQADDFLGAIDFEGADGTDFVSGATIAARVDGTPGADDMPTRLVFSTTADGASSPTTRMTIKNGGEVCIGTTDAHVANRNALENATTGQLTFRHSSTTAGRYNIVGMNSGSAFIVSDSSGGTGVQLAYSGTSWSTLSDERFKTDLEPIESGLSKVATLRALTGRLVTDPEDKRRSFLIAQDVDAVLPEAVDKTDPEALALSYTEVVPLLVAALKESKERIEQLEAKVAALESA